MGCGRDEDRLLQGGRLDGRGHREVGQRPDALPRRNAMDQAEEVMCWTRAAAGGRPRRFTDPGGEAPWIGYPHVFACRGHVTVDSGGAQDFLPDCRPRTPWDLRTG